MAEQSSGGFWSSLPGVLTGVAAVITAITGLYLAVQGQSPDTADAGQSTNQQQSQQVETIVNHSPQPQSPVATDLIQHRPEVVVKPNNTQIKDSRLGHTATQTTQPTKTIAAQAQQPRLQQVGPVQNLSLAQTASPIDCKAFPTKNSVRSLMSWSNHYHAQIEDAGTHKGRAFRPCKKTIEYRARAHCKTPDDINVRQALSQTLSLCRAAGISWKDILDR